jgi:hypothetical protein
MPFITQGKTNWKYILIVVILAFLIGGGILVYQYRWVPIVEKPTLLPEVFKKSTCYCSSADDCYKNYDVKTESQFWECSENKCFYQCIETAPIQFSPGVEGMTFCMSVATSIGWPPLLKGGEIEENSVLLEWTSASEENAIEFNIYRKIASEEDINNLNNKNLASGFWEIEKQENLYDVIKNENVTSFVDQEVESEKTYLYGITGTDRFCHEGNFFEFFVVSFPNEIKIWKGGEMTIIWKAEEVIEDETADWKTYRNEKYGFEFQYPPIPDCGFCKLDRADEEGFMVNRTSLDVESLEGLTLSEFANKEMEMFEIESREEHLIDGKEAIGVSYRFGGMNRYGQATFIKKDDKVIILSFTAGGFCCTEGEEIYELELYSAILSTFRFLEENEKPIYPDDYILKNDEIPLGFQLEALSKESMELVLLTGNPGFFDTREYKILFAGADPSKIEKFHASFYVKPENHTTDELGVFVIKFKSEENLNIDLEKIKNDHKEEQDTIFLKNKEILIMVWSDSNSYREEVRQIVDKLKVRLNLQEI